MTRTLVPACFLLVSPSLPALFLAFFKLDVLNIFVSAPSPPIRLQLREEESEKGGGGLVTFTVIASFG